MACGIVWVMPGLCFSDARSLFSFASWVGLLGTRTLNPKPRPVPLDVISRTTLQDAGEEGWHNNS